MFLGRLFAKTCFTLLCLASIVAADDLSISWFTVDGGGGYSAAGNFELEGTLGQPDAGPASGPMTGGAFELAGGFWTLSSICTCLGDMNGDGSKNGGDIQQFVNCLLAGGDCACANVDLIGGVTTDDVDLFVADLLTGGICP